MDSIDVDQNLHLQEEYGQCTSSIWVVNSPPSNDYVDLVFHLDEDIMEDFLNMARPWEDMHHHSYFYPTLVLKIIKFVLK